MKFIVIDNNAWLNEGLSFISFCLFDLLVETIYQHITARDWLQFKSDEFINPIAVVTEFPRIFCSFFFLLDFDRYLFIFS